MKTVRNAAQDHAAACHTEPAAAIHLHAVAAGAKSRRLIRRLLRAGRSADGSAIVETAMVLPLFCSLMFGTALYGMALISYCSANYAANVGARYGSMGSLTSLSPLTTTQVQTAVTNSLYVPGTTGTPAITVEYLTQAGGTSTNNIGNVVHVKVKLAGQSITVPFGGTKTFTLQTNAYRTIIR